MPQNLEAAQKLRQRIRNDEASKSGVPLDTNELPLIAGQVYDLHNLVFGDAKHIQVVAIEGVFTNKAPESQFVRLMTATLSPG